MTYIERGVLVGQPIIFSVGVILARFVSWPTSVESLIRPLLVVIGLAVVTLLVFRVLTRSWTWAAILSSAFVLFTLRESVPGLVLAGIGAWWLLVAILRRVQGRPPAPMHVPRFIARASGIFSLAFLMVMAYSAWDAHQRGQLTVDAAVPATTGQGGPSIYLLMLDGYPRDDTLRETFGISNEELIGELGRLGFAISDGARSNYNKTWPTLASALNGTYLDELVGDRPIPPDAETQIRWLHAIIEEASLLDALRERGYRIRTLPPPFVSAALTSADDYLDEGHITEFEARLVWNTPWMLVFREPLTSFLLDGQRDLVVDNLARTAELAEESAGPQFLLTHVHAPHTPFVLSNDPDFKPSMPACFPLRCTVWAATVEELGVSFDEYRDDFRDQLDALNDLLLETVRRVVAADPEAVVILMSDHGARYSLAELDEHYRSFLAARTPGVDGLYPNDESTVNVLRRLLDAYFDADLPPLPYRSWDVHWYLNFVLTPRDGG